MNKDKMDALLSKARDRFDDAFNSDQDNREEALDDLEFLSGQQWPDSVRTEREDEGRPILTINRMPQFLRQVTGDIRQTNPAINVIPGDSDASDDMAEIFDGLIRQIERASDATGIYERAAESAASCGIGWFRILTDYVDSRSFEQEIKIKPIENPFSVYCDPEAKDSTRKDANWMFVTQNVPLDIFKEDFPNADQTGWDGAQGEENLKHWYSADSVTIAEYFYKEPVKRKLYQLNSGEVTDQEPPEGIEYVSRDVDDHKIMWCKMSGNEFLEDPRELPGKYIPVIAVVGEEMHVGERIVRTGVIRYAKDAQRMYNYWRTAQTELVALQPKAPYLVTPNHIKGFENYWENANKKNYPFLPFNPDERGMVPQRLTPPMPSSGMMQEIQMSAEDMKATTGIYDAGLGNRSNEQSGVAIRQRQLESDISTSIYVDNLSRAINHCGQIIVDWVPTIYDTTRAIRILGKDDSASIAEINTPMQSPYGPVLVNDMGWGKYDVIVQTGPNYSTQRQESVESMMAFVEKFPQAAPIVGDLIAKNMDWPGADQFAERLKKMVPPEMRDDEEEPSEEQKQQMQAAEARQAKQVQIQETLAEAEVIKAQAEAEEAQSKAMKAKFELKDAELDLVRKGAELDTSLDGPPLP